MNQPYSPKDTPAWIFFVWASFSMSLFLMCVGIYYVPTDWWIKGYLYMGMFFSVGSAFTLAKTVRDNYEAQKLFNPFLDRKPDKTLAE
jgi:hypothetical protein